MEFTLKSPNACLGSACSMKAWCSLRPVWSPQSIFLLPRQWEETTCASETGHEPEKPRYLVAYREFFQPRGDFGSACLVLLVW
jgi:hypothetical protein